MFVELEELHLGQNEQLEWRETARWIKYEEDVLEESDRWGKPHVSTLSFRSLLELRQCLDYGLVRLDMTETGLSAICSTLVDEMVKTDQIAEEYRTVVLQALLLRHVHQSDPHAPPEEPTAHETQASARRQSQQTEFSSEQPGSVEHSGLSRSFSLTPNKNTGNATRLARHATVAEIANSRLLASSLESSTDFLSNASNSVQPEALAEEEPLSSSNSSSDFEAGASQSSTGVDLPSHPPSPLAHTILAHAISSDRKTKTSRLVHSATLQSLCKSPLVAARQSKVSLSFPGHTPLHNGGTSHLAKTDFERLKSVQVGATEVESTSEGECPVEADVVTSVPCERGLWKHLPSDAEGTTVLVGSLDFLEAPIVAFVRLSEGQRLNHVTEVPVPVRFIFVLIGPPRDGSETSCHSAYHEVGRSIATLMANEFFQRAAYDATSSSCLLDALDDFLDQTFVIPPGKWDSGAGKDLLLSAFQQTACPTHPTHASQSVEEVENGIQEVEDPLARTGKFCGGMIRDLQRLRKRYVSDITDAKKLQVIFASLFMYFAALAPVITFGGLLSNKTMGVIALSEMLVATSLGGMFFSLFSGQPLMLIGPTGPLLVFEEVVFDFCTEYSIPYLPFRFWTGMWIFVALFAVVATDASLLVNKFTRFTSEVFAALIGSIFMYEALKSIYKTFVRNPLSFDFCQLGACQSRTNWTEDLNISQCVGVGSRPPSGAFQNEPNSAFVYFILVIGTFTMAYSLRILRHSKYLSKGLRRTVSDFGILITITIAVLFTHFLFGDVATEKIAATSFDTTNGRPWLVNPLGGNLNVGYIFAAIIPGLLVAFLIFIETQVTALIVGSPDHKLVKGQAFHWDLMIVAGLVIVSSMLGLPWICGTPVPSLSHTTSLLVYRKKCAPGETPSVIGAVEQRISNFAIHTLLLLTLTTPLAKLLQLVPVAVLFGVFLYLGCTSVLNLQFVHRIVLLLVPREHHPHRVGYVREVRTRSMHLFTAIQLGCLVALSVAKLTPAALGFPIIILLMLPLRNYIVTRFFSTRELDALDPEGLEGGGSESAEDEFKEPPLPA